MRTKNQISNVIRNALSSTVWQSLKRSLLGNELIEYGATIAYENEIAYDTFYRNLFTDTADMRGLCYLGYAYEVPFEDFKPAYIRVKMPTLSEDITYPPFSVVINAGSLMYTNIEYVKSSMPDREVTVNMYQGNVYTTSTSTMTRYPDSFSTLNVDIQPLAQFKVSGDVLDNQIYWKLGRAVIPNSVYLFNMDSGVVPYSLQTAINESPTAYNFRLMKGYDNSLNIYYSDGVHGKAYEAENNRAFWLNCTFYKYDVTNTPRSIRAYNFDFELHDSDIISESAGVESSIVAARTTLSANLAIKSVIATPNQLRQATNAHHNVIDCLVSQDSKPNAVTVYIKLIFAGDVYSDIEEEFRLYGEIVTTYRAVEGNRLELSIILNTYDSLTEDVRNQVVNLLTAQYAYNVLSYRPDLSVSIVSSRASEIARSSVSANLQFEYFLNGEDFIKMVLRPMRGTIKILNGNNLVAWDVDGYIYGFTPQNNFYGGVKLFKFGDFFISPTYSSVQTAIYNSAINNVSIAASSDLRFTNYTDCLKYRNSLLIHYYFDNGDGMKHYYRLFDRGRSFTDGDYSIMHTTHPTLSPLFPVDPNLYLSCAEYVNSFVDSGILLSDNSVLALSENSGGLYVLNRYTISPSGLYYINSALNSYALGVYSASILYGQFVHTKYAVYLFEESSLPVCVNLNDSTNASVTPLNYSNITSQLKVGDSLIKCGYEDSFYVITNRIETGGAVQVLYWCAGISVVYGRQSYLSTVGSLKEIYVSVPGSAIQVLSADVLSVTYRDINAGIIWTADSKGNIVELAREGKAINTLVYNGTVSYDQRTLNFENASLFTGMTLQFESTDFLNSMEDSYFPVVKSVKWQE